MHKGQEVARKETRMQKLEMIPLKSSNVVAVGYDGSLKQLYVQFENWTYIYEGVNQNLYFQLMESKSKGKFLRNKIIGQYEGKRQDAQDK